jgi:hypothetical protein
MKVWSGILIALVSMSACGRMNTVKEGTTSFYFGEPQPTAATAQSEFSEAFIGQYSSAKDSTLSLSVTSTAIYTEFPVVFFVTQSDMDNDEDVFVQDGLLHGIKENEALQFQVEHDTFYAIYPNRTSIFEIGTDEVLGQMDDAYFLNYNEGDGLWSTILLRIDADGQLLMESIDHDPVLKTILKFKQVEEKMLEPFLTYIARPTAKEFSKLVDAKAFTDSEVYIPNR